MAPLSLFLFQSSFVTFLLPPLCVVLLGSYILLECRSAQWAGYYFVLFLEEQK